MNMNITEHINDDFRVFFVVAKTHDDRVMSSLKRESEWNRDIIMGDFYENTYNDSLKLHMIFEWSYKHCNFQYLLKTYDDNFVNIKVLFRHIESFGSSAKGIYAGTVRNKYHVRESTGVYHPSYVAAPTVLFSYDVVRRFIPYFFEKPFRLEDVYVGFLAFNANVTATSRTLFKHGDGRDICAYDDTVLSLQFEWKSPRKLECMKEFYYEMLARNSHNNFVYDHYRKSKDIMDLNLQYDYREKENHGFRIDTRYMMKANYSNLDDSYHVGKLLSTFSCNTTPLKLVVMLLTHPANLKRRNVVRETWGKNLTNHVNDDFRVFFVVGKVHDEKLTSKLHNESARYRDIVMGDFYESFYNNSWKLDMMFEWSYKHCQFEYLLKVDDDNFVHMSNIFKLITTLQNNGNNGRKVYLGRIRDWSNAMRYSKYSFTYEEYRNQKLRPFVAGGAVLMSSDFVSDVMPYLFLGTTKPPMKLEDVYTGFLAYNANIHVTHNKWFKHSNRDQCTYDESAYSLHFYQRKNPDEVTCMKRNFKEMLKVSADDEFTRLHYL